MAAATKIAAAEAQNAAYREAKISQCDRVMDAEPAWVLTQVQLALSLDLGQREHSGAALLTVAPTNGKDRWRSVGRAGGSWEGLACLQRRP